MPAAARAGDKTTHASKPLGPGLGSPNVLIGKRSAWRAVIDMHTCPLSDPGPSPSGIPHVGGVVTSGSTTVFINNSPAVRQGDMVQEATGTNMILEGEPTVMIG